MGGGTLWKSVARAVGAAAAPAAASVTAGAAHCAACSAGAPPTASPRARAVSCSCKAAAGAVQAHPSLTAVSYGPGQFWDLDEWEIAGDEERDHYVFGSLPTTKEVEEASSDLKNAIRLGFFTPPVPKPEAFSRAESPSTSSRGPTIVEVTEVSTVTTVGDVEDEVTSDLSAPTSTEIEAEIWLEPPPLDDVAAGSKDLAAPVSSEVEPWIEPPPYEVVTSPRASEAPSSAMLEAFHQFQHNPQVQGMVVSLATDKGVWDAVLANEKIKEFRRNFITPTSEDALGDATEQEVNGSSRDTNVFSRFFWNSKKAFSNFISNFQDFVMGLFDTAEKKGPGSSDNEKTTFIERSVKACMVLAILVLTIVVFKRSAIVRRG